MPTWEEFEIDCTDYLNCKFGEYANFIHQGGTDSTLPDILVKTQSGNKFYIDVKHSPAQCGQFVLIPDITNSSFIYSKQNVNQFNSYSRLIMEYMNESFDAFRESGTAGKDIKMENASKIFSDWIIQVYKEKGVRYFITNDYVIFSVEEILEYFEVTAKYRIKRSGSSEVGKARIHSILTYIRTTEYIISGSRIDGGKLFVKSQQNLHNKRFVYQQYEYMFSERNGEYEVRKLSNTYNANVIFSITKIEGKSGLTEEQFIEILE